MKALITTLGFTILSAFVSPGLFGQTAESDKTATLSTVSEDQSYALNEGGQALQTWHKTFHTTKNSTVSADNLKSGNTYTRYGELAFPKGYGVQVIAFKNIKNLRKYLHMYEQKELYIQVVALNDFQNEKIYRVILGADENQRLIEKEISLFNNAGVHAVLRKHKDDSSKEKVSVSALR